MRVPGILLPIFDKYICLLYTSDGIGCHLWNIRLLDPPLHEFVPHDLAGQETMAKEMGVSVEEIKMCIRDSKMNCLLVNALLATGQLKSGQEYDFEIHQEIEDRLVRQFRGEIFEKENTKTDGNSSEETNTTQSNKKRTYNKDFSTNQSLGNKQPNIILSLMS